jgi:hypothetical protein
MCVVPFVIFTYPEMADLKEQHVCIIFLFKLEKNATETFKMLKVCFGEQEWEEHNYLNDFPSSKMCDLCYIC